MKLKYIRTNSVRKLVKSLGKQAGKDFLSELDHMVDKLTRRAADQFNGHKKRLDGLILKIVSKII